MSPLGHPSIDPAGGLEIFASSRLGRVEWNKLPFQQVASLGFNVFGGQERKNLPAPKELPAEDTCSLARSPVERKRLSKGMTKGIVINLHAGFWRANQLANSLFQERTFLGAHNSIEYAAHTCRRPLSSRSRPTRRHDSKASQGLAAAAVFTM